VPAQYRNINTQEVIEFVGAFKENGTDKYAFQWIESKAFSGKFIVFVSAWNRFSMFWERI
jgi:hypothetical protein